MILEAQVYTRRGGTNMIQTTNGCQGRRIAVITAARGGDSTNTAARGVDTSTSITTGITVTGIMVTGIIETGLLRTRDGDWYDTRDWYDTDTTHVATHRHTDGLVCWYY